MIYIEYIANYLGLDINNKLVVKDIAEIENKDAFIDFAKEHIKHTSLDYMNGLQKLTQLKKLYMQELNKDREEKAQTQSQQLEEKFRKIKPLLVEEFEKFKTPKLDLLKEGDHNYFTKFEIDTFNRIGDERRLIKLCNEFRLQAEIEKSFLKLIYKKDTKALPIQRKIPLSVKRF